MTALTLAGQQSFGRLARSTMRRLSRPAVIATAAVLVLFGLAVFGTRTTPGPTMDEGVTLVYPELMLHGEVPFKDFQSSYGPGTYLPLAAAYDLTTPSVVAERAVGATYRLAIILAIVALMWPLGAWLAMSGGALAILAIMPAWSPEPTVAFGWFFSLACLLWSLWTARTALARSRLGRPASYWWVASGVLAGAAGSARPDLGAAGLIACAVLVFAGSRRGLVTFAGGLILGLTPLIWNLFAAGWSNIWTFGVEARMHQLPLSGYVFPAGLGYLVALAATALLALIAALRERRKLGPTPITTCWIAVAILAVLMVPQTLQRPDPGHFIFVAPLTFGLLPWALDLGRTRSFRSSVIPALCGVAIIISAATALDNRGVTVRNDGRSYPLFAGFDSVGMQRMLSWVDRHVTRGRTLFVGPRNLKWAFWAETEIYYLQPKLHPSDFYLELGPGDDYPVFTRRLIAGIRRADVLILQRLPVAAIRQTVWPLAKPGSSLPNSVVRADFRQAYEAGAYSVWFRRSGSL